MRLALLALSLVMGLGAPMAHGQTGNPANDALLSRSAAQQRDAFRNLLRQNGHACAEVAVLFPAGLDAARHAYWDVSCRDAGPWRVTLRAERWSSPVIQACGQDGSLGTGPCFRPVTRPARNTPQVTASAVSPQCRAACQSQPHALQNACLQRCASGGTIQAALPLGPSARAMRGRHGFIYAAEPPSTAFGFASGQTDRLAANMAAIRACEAIVGRNQCRLALDFPNACGALAQAVTSSPPQVRRLATGVGQTREQAEAQALNACRGAEARGSSITCRIAASGC